MRDGTSLEEVSSSSSLSGYIKRRPRVGEPPLPIPNREVKPDGADGTDLPVGRVGGRRASTSP